MMREISKKSVYLITTGCFFSFFIFGFVDNLKGPTIPALLKDMGFSYAEGGTILFGAYVGFFVATLFSGILSDLAGKKSIIILAGLALLVGISGYAFSNVFALFVVTMVFVGLGLGSLELGGNSMIVDIHRENKGKYLNLLAFFHGLGSMTAPFYAGALLDSGFSWRSVYQLSLTVVVLLPLYFLFMQYPRNSSESSKIDFKHLGKKMFTREMLWLYALVSSYVAAEIGIASWLVEFLQKVRSESVVFSSTNLSIYFGVMMAGRFLGSFLVDRVGYIKIMTYASIFSTLCIAIGIFGPSPFAIFLPLTGLFFSIIFPTATAVVSGLHSDNMGAVLGVFFSFGGIGGMLGPWVVGIFSDLWGIKLGMSSVTVFCLLMILSLLRLSRCVNSKSETARCQTF